MFTDTHAHLYFDQFKEDYEQMLETCVTKGITTIINIGVDIEKSQVSLYQAANNPNPHINIYSTIGVHPHNLEGYLEQTDEKIHSETMELENIYRENPKKVVAVGECGLDYFFEGNEDYIPLGLSVEEIVTLQKKLLLAHIKLADTLKLPLSIHCRNSTDPHFKSAWKDVLELLNNSQSALHCYSGDMQITQLIMDSPHYVSFAGNITYKKNEHLREAAKVLPLGKILLETDAPFLAPQRIRGERNDPSSVLDVAECIAALRGISVEEVAQTTTDNATKLFVLQ